MLTPARMLRRLRSLLTSSRKDDELDDELRFHVEMETEKRVRLGVPEAQARAEAVRLFGGTRYRDETRDARGVRPVEDFLQDLKVGARTIVSQRTYAAVAVLTLAVGIGATTALGSAVYKVLFAPYPFPDADRIVTLWQTDQRSPGARTEVAPANFLDWKERAKSFDAMAAAEPYGFDWISPEGPLSFDVTLVTADFFPIQGMRPLLGRTFAADEFEAGRANVVVLTERAWRGRFGGDSSLVGRVLVLDSMPMTVIGVVPEDAMRPFAAEMFAPKVIRPEERTSRTAAYWQIIGRLAPNVSIDMARQELTGVSAQMAVENPATNARTGATVVSLRDAIAGSARLSLLVLLGAVAFVMLIACVNVANLQLAEAIRRRRELAIRTAIGAGRGRLVRQLLTESLLLALIGCVTALAIAYAGIGAIRAFAPVELWQLQRLTFDGATLTMALTLALVAAASIAVLPVASTARIALAESLAAGGRSGGGDLRRRRANRVLVVSEVALAVVLLVGAGLMLRSLTALGRVDRGFDERGVAVTTVQAWSYYTTAERRAEFVRQAIEQMRALPGVQEVGMSSSLPLSWPIGAERSRVRIEGQDVPPGDEPPSVRVAATTSGYFSALSVPLVVGRMLSETDIAGSTPVAIVNQAFARRYFRDVNPVGKRITFGFMGPPVAREIVGIVGDMRHEGLHADPAPTIFVPHAQASTGAIHLVAKVSGTPATFELTFRKTIAALNGAMPLSGFATMEGLVSQSLRERRFQLGLLACFSVTALFLAAIGIYGVMSRATNERSHEIGVRMAIGAAATDVRMMVLRNGGVLALAGIAIGLAGAVALTRYMASMLFEVQPLDVPTYAMAAGILLVVALLASWLPAWRASTVDPVEALRSD